MVSPNDNSPFGGALSAPLICFTLVAVHIENRFYDFSSYF